MKRLLFLTLIAAAVLLMSAFVCVGCDSGVVAGTGDTQMTSTTVAGVLGSTSTTLSMSSTSLTSTTLGAPPTSLQSTTTTKVTTTTTAKATTTTNTTLGTPPQSTTTTGSWTHLTVDIGPVVPIDPWTIFEETDSHMQWNGPWIQRYSSKASGGGYRGVADPASVLIRFTGQRISFQAMKDKGAGIAKLTLDGSHVYMVDLYNEASSLSSQPAWLSDPLPKGTHTVLIEWTGTKNPKNIMATDYVQFDYVAVYGGILINP